MISVREHIDFVRRLVVMLFLVAAVGACDHLPGGHEPAYAPLQLQNESSEDVDVYLESTFEIVIPARSVVHEYRRDVTPFRVTVFRLDCSVLGSGTVSGTNAVVRVRDGGNVEVNNDPSLSDLRPPLPTATLLASSVQCTAPSKSP